MNATMRELGLNQLTSQERIALALEIWESLGSDRPANPTASQIAELTRRDAELNANSSMALTWEQIRANVENHE